MEGAAEEDSAGEASGVLEAGVLEAGALADDGSSCHKYFILKE